MEIIESSNEEIKLKTCFVITPIGDENSSIRRHIDGVINAAIRPALCDKYNVKVAHEFSSTGSINNQVIIEIYNSDLVIANLTELNPNVMYELAIRHALKKPVIMIMEKGDTKLPFDVANERTIFYKNDFQGVLDLKKEIIKTEKNVEENKNVSNPIYDALYDYTSDKSLIKKVESESSADANVLKSILNKINNLEKSIYRNSLEITATETMATVTLNIELEFSNDISKSERANIIIGIQRKLKEVLIANFDIEILFSRKNIELERMLLKIRCKEAYLDFNDKFIKQISDMVIKVINDYDNRVKCEFVRIGDTK